MQSYENERMCDRERIDRMPVAMAYVPWQYFENVFEPDAALCKGTIFPELYKPFTGRRGGGRRYE